MSKRVRNFNILYFCLKHLMAPLLIVEFIFVALCNTDPFNRNTYVLWVIIIIGLMFAYYIFFFFLNKTLEKKAKRRLNKNLEYINQCEYENRISDAATYLENELKREYVAGLYFNCLLNYAHILLMLDRREESKNIIFNTKWKKMDDVASFIRFVFYVFEGNVEMINVEHNKVRVANLGNDYKKLARYLYSIINDEENIEKPNNLMYPIVNEIIEKYKTVNE